MQSSYYMHQSFDLYFLRQIFHFTFRTLFFYGQESLFIVNWINIPHLVHKLYYYPQINEQHLLLQTIYPFEINFFDSKNQEFIKF